MRRSRAVLAPVLLAGIASLGAPVTLALAPVPTDADVVAPLERLLIVLPTTSAVEGGADPWTDTALVASRLRYADPKATVLVAPIDGPASWSDPIRVAALSLTSGQLLSSDPAADAHAAVVEILGDATGIAAYRVGALVLSQDDLRLPTWHLPAVGVDAVVLDGAWWSLPSGAAAVAPAPADPRTAALEQRARRRVARSPVSDIRRLVAVSAGDVTGDGRPEVALSFRRRFRPTYLNALRPRRAWVDAAGLSAHVGVYRPGDLAEVWVAGTLVRPVVRLEACHGALAVAYSSLHRAAVTRTTAWRWSGFGFLPLPELPGPGIPTCLDIDRDGRADAAILERRGP